MNLKTRILKMPHLRMKDELLKVRTVVRITLRNSQA